ncbi:HlyD family efflux transporter periplasmic adaptor subunit [Labrenzia sp. PHM005]|uniref:HlyD family efflux transporter periplasmic adaptor subunit n=1 Tax=Labrenzia sp. PHM005 TaxID=2590016 RepID=UPI0011404B42|nr:HlyD family efflux transporter periplasmic adaptor subunit [Labrenzia sp. PHM005]QDG77382.1 HlyD family efflux transporter periplasmic adaptor subunit [Labrenzia sp. PHM005]
MNIIHERPSQRLHYRVTAPMRVTLDAQTVDAVDWGLGGCRISGLSEPLPEIGSRHTLFCTLPFQGFNITLKAEAEVVRTQQETGETAFKFVELGERETALMQHFIEDLVRGKMTEVTDTIVRIDTPVTPVPTKPDPNPAQSIPVRRWPVRQIMMTLFYLILGLAVFGYVGVYIFATLFRLEVSTAVVSADRYEVTAPVSGRLTSLNVRTGNIAAAHLPLAFIENVQLVTDIRKAETALMQAQVELAEHELYLKAEADRETGYSLVAKNNLRQARAETVSLNLAVETARDRLERYKNLFDQGYLKRDVLATAQLELAAAESGLEKHLIHVAELEQLGATAQDTGVLNGEKFNGLKPERIAEVARWQKEVDFRIADLKQLKDQQITIPISAGSNATVVDVIAAEGQTLKAGAPIAVLEEDVHRTITAFLTQEEVPQIRKGSPARIYVSAEDRWIEATVSQINRTDGFVDEITQMHRFRAPDSRSAKVQLNTSEGELPASGTPVIVYFERHRSNKVLRLVSRYFGGTE